MKLSRRFQRAAGSNAGGVSVARGFGGVARESRVARDSRPANGAGLGVLCALLLGCASLLGWTSGMESGALDALFRLRGARYPSPNLVLLVVDDATVARAGQYPLPRRMYADAVRKLSAAGVKTIAFDFLFTTPSGSPADDKALIEACRESGRVVQASAFHVPVLFSPVQSISARADSGPAPARFSVGKVRLNKGVLLPARTAVWSSSAMPQLQAGAPAMGHVNVYPSADGTLRQIPHLIGYRGAVYPSLALATAASFLDVAPNQIEVQDREVIVGSRRVPLDGNGESVVNWVGGNNTFTPYTFNELQDGRVPLKNLKGRIVIIGATAAGSFEHHATPFSPVQPAVELQANAVDDILMNRPLRTAPLLLQIVLLFGFAATAGALTAPGKAFGGLGRVLAVCVLLIVVAAAVMIRSDFYIPTGTPLLAGVLAAALSTAVNYRREWQENWQANVSVAALARGAALLSTGDNRERLHDVIRDAARDTLNASDAFLVIPSSRIPATRTEEILNEIARVIIADGRATVWPAPGEAAPKTLRRRIHAIPAATVSAEYTVAPSGRTAPATLVGLREKGYLPTPESRLNGLFAQLCEALGAEPAIVAAPLPPALSNERGADILQRTEGGALVAVALRGNRFSQRDAGLAEALARQVSLALENQAYAQRLRARIDLANRDLRDAYSVLSEQSIKLVAAIESVDDALLVTDENGLAIFVNPASARILRDATPKLGDDIAATLKARDLDSLSGLFDEMHGAQLSTEWKTRCETSRESEGAKQVLAAQLTPLLRDDGISLGAMLVVSDVTAERELDTMKSDFVAFVAHELRTPLTTILGYASLLHDDSAVFAVAERVGMTDAIMRHCQRLNRMISELLDVSRLEAGRELELKLERFDFVELCEQVVESQRMALNNPEDYFLYVDAAGAIEIHADRDRIEQVVTNLVSNAVKYSPEGGSVRVEIKASENSVALSVADKGMGMTAQQQAALFQKFYRTPDAQQSGIEGTGLGLFLVKQLIEAHGGAITVESEQGKGATFRVALPREKSTP